jgi:hypothetical protein
MKAPQRRRGPAEWEESAPLLPQTARDLPAGRHQFHKERLMDHIQQDIQRDESTTAAAPARPKNRWFRLPRPAFTLPVVALAVTGAVVAGLVLHDSGSVRPSGGGTGPLTTVVGAATTKGLPQLLDQVSLAAAEGTHPTVKPGQYIYIESKSAETFIKRVDGKNIPASHPLHRRQVWHSADGTKGWLIDPTVNHSPEGVPLSQPDEQGNTPKVYLDDPSYDFLAQLTTDPDKLLKMIYKETEGQGNTRDQQAFTTIGDLLTASYPPAELYSALFKAAAKIPGIVVVNSAQDAIGRSGVAVARRDRTSGERTEWIFDKKTHVFLGERTVQVKKVSGVVMKPGTILFTSAITKRAIVDDMKQVPAHNG